MHPLDVVAGSTELIMVDDLLLLRRFKRSVFVADVPADIEAMMARFHALYRACGPTNIVTRYSRDVVTL